MMSAKLPASAPRLQSTPKRADTVRHALKDNIAVLPPTNTVKRVKIPAINWSVDNVEGKKASVTIYNYLAQKYNNKLNVQSAMAGLALYDEVVEDARKRPGAHPNIDLLFKVIEQKLELDMVVE